MLGVVAAVALLIYAVLLFALVKLIPITLTLPGIAGLVLTLGVAADANIVIFERIKEEVRAGQLDPRAPSPRGYAKALRTIIDANVVTIGVAFILFMLATGGRQGLRLHAAASARSSRSSPRCWPPRPSSARWRARACCARASALGAGEERRALELRLHGQLAAGSSRSRA